MLDRFCSLLLTILLTACAVHRPPSDLEHRQQETLAAMRLIGNAASAYATDNCSFPAVDSLRELRPLLEPVYITRLPEVDAWGTPLLYRCVKHFPPPSCGCDQFVLASAGGDRQFALDVARHYTDERSTTSPDDDMVIETDVFVRWPQSNAPVPRADDLAGRYLLTRATRAALANDPILASVPFRPVILVLNGTGTFSTDDGQSGTWSLVEQRPLWYVTLRADSQVELRVSTRRKPHSLEFAIGAGSRITFEQVN
ncbi:MAG: hypothetical protein ACXW3E_02075 [Thermoanaerobaculia bacterium]